MIDRSANRFGLTPKQLAADTAYGSGGNLAWLMERGIEPHERGEHIHGTSAQGFGPVAFAPRDDINLISRLCSRRVMTNIILRSLPCGAFSP
jgi:hypothetical protein